MWISSALLASRTNLHPVHSRLPKLALARGTLISKWWARSAGSSPRAPRRSRRSTASLSSSPHDGVPPSVRARLISPMEIACEVSRHKQRSGHLQEFFLWRVIMGAGVCEGGDSKGCICICVYGSTHVKAYGQVRAKGRAVIITDMYRAWPCALTCFRVSGAVSPSCRGL